MKTSFPSRVLLLLILLMSMTVQGCSLFSSPASKSTVRTSLSSGKPVDIPLVLRDKTPTVQESALTRAADAYLCDLMTAALKEAIRRKSEVRAEFYVSPSPNTSLGDSRHHIAWQGKLVTPRERDRLIKDQAERMRSLFWDIQHEKPVQGESAILEHMAELMRRGSELPYGDEAARLLIVITDLQQYQKGFVTTAQIVTASDEQFQQIIERVKRQYPAVPRPPQRVVFIVTTPPERSNEAHRTRLRRFWEAVCKNWGISQIEFVAPPSDAINGVEALPESKKSPPTSFQESQQPGRIPSLTINNASPYRAVLTLVSQETRQSSNYELPGEKKTALSVPAGRFQWTLSFPRGESNTSTGKCRFRTYSAYETTFYVGNSSGGPLIVGEPE